MQKRNFWDDFSSYQEAYIKFKEYINQGTSIAEISDCYSIDIELINDILVRFDEVIDPIVYKAIREHYSQFKIDDNKVVIISDTHVGNKRECLKLFDNIFNYCHKYGYKNIIHAGDFIEGNSNPYDRKDLHNIQIEKVLKIFDQGEIPKMFYLYGNHEYNLKLYDSVNLKDCLKELDNLVYIGRGNSYIQLNDNDPINIVHKLSNYETFVPKIETNLKLEGHHHLYHFYDNNAIYLPALSLVGGCNSPGFVTLMTTENEFILDVYNKLNDDGINHCEQKVIKKHL